MLISAVLVKRQVRPASHRAAPAGPSTSTPSSVPDPRWPPGRAFHRCPQARGLPQFLEYAVELNHFDSNPLKKVKWRPNRASETVDRRVVVNPAQARDLLAAVRCAHTGRRGLLRLHLLRRPASVGGTKLTADGLFPTGNRLGRAAAHRLTSGSRRQLDRLRPRERGASAQASLHQRHPGSARTSGAGPNTASTPRGVRLGGSTVVSS